MSTMNRHRTSPTIFADRDFISAEVHDAIVGLLGRLEQLIDEETAMLQAHRHGGIAECTRRKRQGLLELDRHMRALGRSVPSQSIIARLAAFRKKLEVNSAALKVELGAAQEVNAIIVRAMREAESDGTYSRAHGRGIYDM